MSHWINAPVVERVSDGAALLDLSEDVWDLCDVGEEGDSLVLVIRKYPRPHEWGRGSYPARAGSLRSGGPSENGGGVDVGPWCPAIRAKADRGCRARGDPG
jgi:hypothetical protein